MTSRSGKREAGDSEERILVGRIVGAHGIRGEVSVEVYSDVEDRFDPGRPVLLNRRGISSVLVVETVRPHKGRLLVGFEGIGDRNRAEELRGGELEVDRSDVPPAPEGSYYHFELVGCRVIDRVLGELGEVADIVEDGGGILLVVRRPSGDLPVPFVDPYLERVDIEERRIDCVLPEGFLEACG